MNETLFLLIISVISYLIGSVPSAYIIVKLATGNDLRKMGTGNIGAMNSYDETKKKWIGITVFLMDCAKGIIAVIISRFLFNEFAGLAFGAIFAVVGHNFSIFLKFKGGRGLATGTGAMMLINPIFVLVWVVLYELSIHLVNNNIHISCVIATIISPLLIFFIPESLFNITSTGGQIPITQLFYCTSAICVIILLKHIEPIYDLMKSKNVK